MEENGEDSHAMQTEDNVEELKESHGAEEEAMEAEEALTAENSGKGSEEKPKRRGRKKVSPGDQVSQKKAVSKEPVTPATPVTPLLDRPARERKSIERFADSVEKEKVKEFKIEKGTGTCLKDIPNVVFKLSKRKWSDESVQLLHKLIYGKRVKPLHVKANILQFSGYVWGANEEREKAKMKEKLEKCVKESLWQVSDLLDLSITKATTKKEDLILKLLEFLDSPHKTTEKLVEEEEQKSKEKKRRKTPIKGKRKRASGQTPRKRQKREAKSLDQEDEDDDHEEEVEEEPEEEPEEVPMKKKRSSKSREPSRSAKSKSPKKHVRKSAKKRVEPEEEPEEEEPEEELEEEPEEAPEEEPEEEPEAKPVKRKRSSKPKSKESDHDVKSRSLKKGVRKSAKKQSLYEPKEEDLEDETETKDVKSKPLSKVSKNQAPKEIKAPVESSSKERKKTDTDSSKVFSRKKKREEHEEEDAPKETQKKGRGASQPNVKEGSNPIPTPSDEELRAAICDLLRDADFSTVTFTDVVKQLGDKFDVDLSQNKAHVKILIQEEISKIVDEDDGEGEGEAEEDTGVEEDAGKEVKEEEPKPAHVAAED